MTDWPPTPSFTLEDAARRVGAYRWVEMRLFEILGGWVQAVPELEVKLLLGAHGHKHAWHAALWQDRLPALREMPREGFTAPANDGVVALMEAIAAPAAPGLTIEKLVGVYRVLIPHKIAAYECHLAHTSTITDAPTIRSLRFVLMDEEDDRSEGEALLASLMTTPEHRERATAHLAALQELLLSAGGIAGRG